MPLTDEDIEKANIAKRIPWEKKKKNARPPPWIATGPGCRSGDRRRRRRFPFASTRTFARLLQEGRRGYQAPHQRGAALLHAAKAKPKRGHDVLSFGHSVFRYAPALGVQAESITTIVSMYSSRACRLTAHPDDGDEVALLTWTHSRFHAWIPYVHDLPEGTSGAWRVNAVGTREGRGAGVNAGVVDHAQCGDCAAFLPSATSWRLAGVTSPALRPTAEKRTA